MIYFFFQAEDGIRDYKVTGVQTCALPISPQTRPAATASHPACSERRLAVDRVARRCETPRQLRPICPSALAQAQDRNGASDSALFYRVPIEIAQPPSQSLSSGGTQHPDWFESRRLAVASEGQFETRGWQNLRRRAANERDRDYCGLRHFPAAAAQRAERMRWRRLRCPSAAARPRGRFVLQGNRAATGGRLGVRESQRRVRLCPEAPARGSSAPAPLPHLSWPQS